MSVIEQEIPSVTTSDTQESRNLGMDLLNACLFVPQAFLSRTPELTPAPSRYETGFQTFSRELQKLASDNQSNLEAGATEALQKLYSALNSEVAEVSPATIEDWRTINTVLFSETMAKIQTQPEWVAAALLAPLAEKEAQYNTKE